MIELRPHQLEALDAMSDSDKGQIIVPTGGGKTMCMIEDVKRQFKSPVSKTIVVVAPRILLANQLCSEFLEQNLMATIMLVLMSFMFIVERHTFYSTTKSDNIKKWYHNSTKHIIMFTTYHSLHKIQDTLDVEVDTIYFDESHNAVQKNFIEAVEYYSIYASRCYFFTYTKTFSYTFQSWYE